MEYAELIDKAKHGRSVNVMAKELGIPHTTLNGYARGDRMPDYTTALILAREAGVNALEALKAIAFEDARRKGMLDTAKKVFRSLLRATNLTVRMAS